MQILASQTRKQQRVVQEAMQVALKGAQKSVWATTPYFFPPKKLRSAIINAAERGVEIHLMTAGKSDVLVMRWAARHIYDRFLTKGVRIYEMNQPSLHAKTVIIDDIYCTVGSYNFDIFSERNLEVNVAMVDGKVAKALKGQYERDLSNCVEVTLEQLRTAPLHQRALHWSAYQCCRLLSFLVLDHL